MKLKFSNFINGIISLVISQILIKIFGVIYSLYLTNKTGFGDKGNAIYMSGYQIYALLLTISSLGIPNAISKIISEKKSKKDYINSQRVFEVSVFIFAFIGFLGCITLFLLSDYISKVILEIPEAKLSLMLLSPAIFFVSINSVIKGYCNGENKIYITAKSQFFEQVIKSVFTIVFVEIVSKKSNKIEILAGVANFATTIATLFSLIYIVKKYISIKNKNLLLDGIIYKKERIINIVKNILSISIPMTISAILSSFGKNIDSITVVRILKNIIGEEKAKIKYGILSSKVDILVALPLSFNIAISTSLIPEISRRKAVNDIRGLIQKIEMALCMTLIIAIPCVFGMFCYSKQIFNLLFPNARNGYDLLTLASVSIVFSMLTQTIYGILQGLGKNKSVVYISIFGLIIKVLGNLILIPIHGIYEKGAILANIMCNVFSFIISFIILKKNIELKINLFKLGIKPIVASTIMIFFSLNIYKIFILRKLNNILCTIFAIIIAVIIYVFFVFVMKMIKKSNIYENTEKSRL